MTDTPPIICSECGKPFNESGMIRHGNVFICASCKPIFMQKLSEGARIDTGEIHYACFWIRFTAMFLDELLIGIPELIAAAIYIHVRGITVSFATHEAVANWLGQLQPIITGSIILKLLYETILVGKFGATVGKMVCKIKIGTADREPVSYLRALCRAVCKRICALNFLLIVVYLIAAFDKQKRAGYDFLCKTRVIYSYEP